MINDLVKAAMKSRDKNAMTAFRSVKAKILNEGTKKGAKELDAEVLFQQMVRKEIKEREEANSFITDHSNDAFVANQAMIEILQEKLPKMYDDEKQKQIVLDTIAELGATEQKDMGKVMGKLKTHQGKMDMKAASALVREKLS